MSDAPKCPKCGAELPPDAPAGLCPKCLLEAGFESQPTPQADPYAPTTPGPSATGFVPPEISKLTDKFPQLEVLELLGHGGMGAVYKARQTNLDRLVALKIIRPEATLDPAFAERFNREAKTLARLSHQHIVAVHDFGEIEFSEADSQPARPLYYFVMEYVDGANLRELIKAGHLHPEQALAIVPQICEALQFAHDEGVVHRDIKPENILIDKHGRVKIADFGLAKLASRSAEEYTLTAAHQVMGTPRYMAPEQMEGSHAVDHRADIYSLGVVFYEMLTGQVPAGHFDPPSKKVHVDVRLDEVVLRAMAREPERRYQQASEVKTQVETICGLSPEATQRIFGTEFRSEATLFGLPLVHIAMGLDPKTGKSRTAKGVIAIGDKAVGVVALGGIAMGGLTFGGLSLGLFALGGFAMGLVAALGGVAVGGLPFGGLALGIIAVGGGAVGLYAGGGWAWGMHVLSGSVQDPEALRLFEKLPWARNWPQWIAAMGVGMPVLVASIFGFTWLVFARQKRNTTEQTTSDQEFKSHQTSPDCLEAKSTPRFSGKAIVGGILATVFLVMTVPAYVVARSSALPVSFGVFLLIFCVMSGPVSCLLGMIAIDDIRHSNGRTRGLGLAFLDAIFFPLLLLDVLVYGLSWLVIEALDERAPPDYSLALPIPIFALLFTFFICAPLDIWIAYRAWRAVAGRSSQHRDLKDRVPESELPTPARQLRLAVIIVVEVLVATVAAVLLLYGLITQPAGSASWWGFVSVGSAFLIGGVFGAIDFTHRYQQRDPNERAGWYWYDTILSAIATLGGLILVAVLISWPLGNFGQTWPGLILGGIFTFLSSMGLAWRSPMWRETPQPSSLARPDRRVMVLAVGSVVFALMGLLGVANLIGGVIFLTPGTLDFWGCVILSLGLLIAGIGGIIGGRKLYRQWRTESERDNIVRGNSRQRENTSMSD